MKNILDIIRKRKSVRSFNGDPLTPEDKEKVLSFTENAKNPYGIPVTFKLLEADKYGLSSPVITGADLFIGAKIEKIPHANEAFGYSFESFVLDAASLGIGTTWIAGTMNRDSFQAAMDLSENEMMPCISPLGYPSAKKSIKESLMRKAIKADERIAFEKLFFDGKPSVPLTREKAGNLEPALEAVRLAPSAVNKQPWRAVITEDAVHFYLDRTKGYGQAKALDIQKVDLGIALCHFENAAKYTGLDPVFSLEDPVIPDMDNIEYIATYKIKK